MHVHDDVLYTARGCNTFYDSFDDCWFAEHCSISVFKMSRPTDFQNVLKHFQIPQFMKSLRGGPFFAFSLPGGGAHPCPPVSHATTYGQTHKHGGEPCLVEGPGPGPLAPPKSGAGSENRMRSPSTFCLPPSAVFQQLL